VKIHAFTYQCGGIRPTKKVKRGGGNAAATGAMVQLSELARLDTCVTVIDAANFLVNFQ
jgi:hypothetical protein